MALGLGLALGLAGCETVRVVDVDPVRFAALPPSVAASGPPLPGRVALVVPPTVLQAESTGDRLRAARPTQLRWPAGRLVEAALRGALAPHFADGVVRVDAAPPAGFEATVRVTEVEMSDDQTLRYFIPVPIPGVLFLTDYDTSLRLGFELQLLDPRGQPLWTRRYDSGRVLWQRPSHAREDAADGLVRVAHETAWRLAGQAAQDLRAWIDDERRKPRQL